MAKDYKVFLSDIIKELSLEVLYMPDNSEDLKVSSRDVSRPGLEFIGFFEYYDNKRILAIGSTEHEFLRRFTEEKRRKAVEGLISKRPPAIIIARNLEPFCEITDYVKKYDVPLLRTPESTSSLISALVAYLNAELAPRITRHGVLMEVYGQGILLTGDSGVGKSETAIELIKRGHRLVADDAVEIRKISNKSLMGSSPENIRHFIELRGIGIINAMRIFGMGAVKLSEKIDLVVNLKTWDKDTKFDRIGIDNKTTNILGIEVPIVTIPINPGRNLAVIVEVAAMNNREKILGYNAAKELLTSLGMEYDD